MIGYIYVIAFDDGAVKVGHTYSSPRGRLLYWCAKRKVGGNMVRVLRGDRWDETAAHQDLRHLRVDSGKTKNVCEWYTDLESVMSELRAAKQASCPKCGKPFPVVHRGTDNIQWQCGARLTKLCFCGRTVAVASRRKRKN